MKLMIVAAILFLAGCAPYPESIRHVLVCSINGVAIYRSPPEHYWKFNGELWSTRRDMAQYKPSVLESCYTEVAA